MNDLHPAFCVGEAVCLISEFSPDCSTPFTYVIAVKPFNGMARWRRDTQSGEVIRKAYQGYAYRLGAAEGWFAEPALRKLPRDPSDGVENCVARIFARRKPCLNLED